MIRLTRCTNASKAGKYFKLHLQAGDSQSHPTPATTARFAASWTGNALPDVKLAPFDPPTASHLVRLGRGLHPTEKKRLAPSVNRKRAYYDLLLTAPKSISVAALLNPTHVTATNVLAAHRNAVGAVCSALGGMIQGQSKTAPPIKKWLAAVFIHTHTREGDPHLHSHLIVPNVGKNAMDAWRAVQVNISGVRRSRLEAIYAHELARSLRAFGLGPEIVMRGCDPEIKSLLPLAKHFAQAERNVIDASEAAMERLKVQGRQPKMVEIHSRSKLPLRPDRIGIKERRRIADEIRRPKSKDADDPKKLSEEGYRWRHMLTNQEDRALSAVLDGADATNPRRVKVLETLPPAISVLVQRAYLRIKPGVPPTPPVWFRALITEAAGRHSMEDLRAGLKERLERRKKVMARIRAQIDADSLAIAQAQQAELERVREALARRGKPARGPVAPEAAPEPVATPQGAVAAPQGVEPVETPEAVAPVVTRTRGQSR